MDEPEIQEDDYYAWLNIGRDVSMIKSQFFRIITHSPLRHSKNTALFYIHNVKIWSLLLFRRHLKKSTMHIGE